MSDRSSISQYRVKPHVAFFKRVFDVLAAVIGLVVFSWLILISYILATIDTRKSGIFVQTRVGRYGCLFNVYKIRTMRDVADVNTCVTTKDDPRISVIGAFIRKCKFDELPQLVNVLLGQMSIVGPRPDVPGFADVLQGEDRVILDIRPGITGLATLKYRFEEQILASVKDPEDFNARYIFADKVQLNKKYIRDLSLWGDIKIILRTFFTAAHLFETTQESMLESELAAFVNAEHSLGVSKSGDTLSIILQSIPNITGKKVIVSPMASIQVIECIQSNSAKPVFVDIDSQSQNITVDTIRACIDVEVVAVICTHTGGWPCDMDSIVDFAKTQNLLVIEDCSQALGAKYKSRPVGALGDIGFFLFDLDTVMTDGGDAGAIVAHSPLVNTLQDEHHIHHELLSAQAIDRSDNVSFKGTSTNAVRISESQSAVARIQLRSVECRMTIRRKYALHLLGFCTELPGFRAPLPIPNVTPSYSHCYIYLRKESLKRGWTRELIIRALRARGVVALNPYSVYSNEGRVGELYREQQHILPVFNAHAESGIGLCLSSMLTLENVEYACNVIKTVVEKASKAQQGSTVVTESVEGR